MSDWQIGDLAMCVLTPSGGFKGAPNPCRKGVIYCVERIVVSRDTGDLGLGLEGINFPDCKLNADRADHYRKIRPDTEPCEEEFTALLKLLKKRSVKA